MSKIANKQKSRTLNNMVFTMPLVFTHCIALYSKQVHCKAESSIYYLLNADTRNMLADSRSTIL